LVNKKRNFYLFKKYGLMKKLSNITPTSHSVLRSLALALTALALYVPANLYPMMTMQYMGTYRTTTIWQGVTSLFETNMWITGSIVLMASIIIPLFKILSMTIIAMSALTGKGKVAASSLLKFIIFIGRWSMIDVFLVALMVALVKFGSFATVTAGTGSYLFAGVVVFTMLSSTTFNKDVLGQHQKRTQIV